MMPPIPAGIASGVITAAQSKRKRPTTGLLVNPQTAAAAAANPAATKTTEAITESITEGVTEPVPPRRGQTLVEGVGLKFLGTGGVDSERP